MNVNLPEKEKVNKSRKTLYIAIAVICVLAVIIVVETQILGNDFVNDKFGITKITNKTEQEEESLKANFKNILNNTMENATNNSLVYTNYQRKENKNDSEIDVNIPYINIQNNEVKKFNEQIAKTFETKTEEILGKNKRDIIYTVKYKASVENNILSLIIYSDLKEGTNAQRVIIQTFNYDINTNKTLSLMEVAKRYNISTAKMQNKINSDIEKEQNKTNNLRELGYEMFSRDLTSEKYKVENISEFFIYNDNIYIIFAYGNEQFTSEMDLVII